MRTLFLSDIHVDIWIDTIERFRKQMKDGETDKAIVESMLEYQWKLFDIPDVERLVLAGDYSNDYLTFTYIVPWLAAKFKEVYLVLGNHDLTCRGATGSKSNLQFMSSEQKIDAMKKTCKAFDNVFLLDGEVVNGIGGCMGMCDFKCEPPQFGLDSFTNWKRYWYDGKFWRFFNQEPGLIWNHFEEKLNNIVRQKPKVVVTHFVPYELGIPFEYRNDRWNYVFYFNGDKFFEELDNDTYWLCGHVHGMRTAEYVTSKGNHIHIVCNPLGYVGERPEYCDIVDYTGAKIERSSKRMKMEDFIVDI